MVYGLLFASLVLGSAVVHLWLRHRDLKNDGERSAREFELLLQVQQAEQRTELLQAHALLMQAQQQLRQFEAGAERLRRLPAALEMSRG